MSEICGDVTPSENNKVGPDFFGFYASEVAELLSQDEGLLPFSQDEGLLPFSKDEGHLPFSQSSHVAAPLYSNGIGSQLSEFKRERLKSLLRHSVFTLTKEVDEMVDPILSVCRIRSCLRCKESPVKELPQKKRKVSPASSDSKECTQCHATSTPQWRYTSDRKCLCNACGVRYLKDRKSGSVTSSDSEAGKQPPEIDDDLRFLLENDSTRVKELMEKHAGELSSTLQNMEQKLEELLNTVMTSCRPMTLTEKQQLQKSIQNLPPKNLDRVVEIIEENKPSDEYSGGDVYVDLAEQSDVTLWRLHFYVKAIKAKLRTL